MHVKLDDDLADGATPFGDSGDMSKPRTQTKMATTIAQLTIPIVHGIASTFSKVLF